ncbi:MAG: VTT domain-containing protein [Bacillota bacterium]|nr:VTT domain-containing protein [Bacillota bacterium]
MNESARSRWRLLLKAVPAVLCAGLLLWFLLAGDGLSVEVILAYTPKKPVLAALLLLGMYAVKSLSILFPILLLQVAAGHLFSTAAALAVNLLGLVIDLTIPFWVGRASGVGLVERLSRRFPKLEGVLAIQQNNTFFLSFFLRVINCLPGDVISLYLGATGTAYPVFLAGQILGSLPSTLCATILGSSISDPLSPMFAFALALTILISLSSSVIYYFYKKKTKPPADPPTQEGGTSH